MSAPTPLVIDGAPVRAHGSLDLLETRLVEIHGNLDATPHGAAVAEYAALAIVEHSDSCVLVTDGPGVSAAALDALMHSAPRRVTVVARRGVTEWHEGLAARGALVLEGAARPLLDALSDVTLVIEQHHHQPPRSPRVACIPGPVLVPATAGSNALLLRPEVEIVPDIDVWARRLAYTPVRPRAISH